MSTADLDPIPRACRLLREGAAELKNCHTLASTGHDWTGEPEAKAAYDEHMATADALERVHAECETLRTGYAAARLEIQSLQARIKTMAEVRVYELTMAHLDGRMRAAQPAGAQQPGDERAAFEQWSKVTNQGYDLARNVSGKLQTFESTETEHAWRGFFHGLRASHGQAPAQAAPAAVAGPVAFTAEHVTYIRRYGGSCRDCADENGVCPNRGLPCADSEKAIRFVLEALAYGINHGYIAAPTTQPAPTPSPSPASQGDALDAARYRYLRDGDWREHEKLESVIRLQLNTLWDETIDAARAAQEGKSHG